MYALECSTLISFVGSMWVPTFLSSSVMNSEWCGVRVKQHPLITTGCLTWDLLRELYESVPQFLIILILNKLDGLIDIIQLPNNYLQRGLGVPHAICMKVGYTCTFSIS